MKKLLLATSALVMFAGAASAEIALSGSARMGLVYSDNGTTSDTVFSSRVRIVFTASGETDGGIAFGASMRADQNGGNADGTANGDSTVFVSGAFGKLTMGDVGGAADALVGQTSGVGYGPNDGLHEIGFVGTTKTAAYYEYSTGAFTVGLGAGQLNSTGQEMNVAVKYSAGGYSAALGWETTDDNANGNPEDRTVKARASDTDEAGYDTVWSVSVDYVAGPTTLTAFYTDYGNDDGLFNGGYDGASTDTQHLGIGVAYDLGGGATAAAGIVRQDNTGSDDQTFADVGLKFSF
jgi:outer membrane protein OmpU